jgi:transcription elongation GreA/GreB family factor
MSRAFVREGDSEESLPERPVSTQPNFVTARGLAQLESRLRELERGRSEARAAGARQRLAEVERDLRYYAARRASAQLVGQPSSGAREPGSPPEAVQFRFGMQAHVRMPDGAQRSFRVVGEDEAEPAAGLISHASPLARALLGRAAGDVVTFGAGELEVLAIEA